MQTRAQLLEQLGLLHEDAGRRVQMDTIKAPIDREVREAGGTVLRALQEASELDALRRRLS